MFYTNVAQRGNSILFRGRKGNKSIQEKVAFSPSLFVLSKKDSKYKSLYGENLEPIKFQDINEAKEFTKKYKDVSGFPIFGNTNYAYQFISSHFKDDIEYDFSSLNIVTIDIETSSEYGFPNVRDCREEVLLISLQNYQTKKVITYGARNFINEDPNVEYVKCANEKELLKKFISDFAFSYPDIITGWNCEFFDMPYLVNRIKFILGDDEVRGLSPWGVIKEKEITKMGRTDLNVELLGISILDYLDLYKKFTYTNQESYKLDHIAKVELGKQKLTSKFATFKEFYTNDWDNFVKYNIVDVKLVDELEQKMKLIELIVTMAYDAKCNFNDIFSSVRTWSCILYNHLLKKNILTHQRDESIRGRTIEGAFVKEPKPGRYDWVVSFDATSLYPSIIMQYNLSPETMVKGYTKTLTVNGLLKRDYDLGDLKQDDVCMTANGYGFRRDKQGLFPEIVQKLFDDRQKYKKLMIEAETNFVNTKDPKYKNLISSYNNYQMARKIQLNSLFGAMANEYFLFYDDRIAEGITITGQYIIRSVVNELNQYLNGVCGTKDYDFAFYGDTDSSYITLGPLIEKFFKNQPKEKVIDILDKVCKEKIVGAINKGCDALADYTNAFERKIIFKREAIADRGVFVAKKRYALNVYDNEGVRYKDPKLKVMGLEIVRSSTPEPVREMLKDAVKLILTKDEAAVQSFISETERDFKNKSVEEISFPRSVNGLSKYGSSSDVYQKGTPIHVRGSLVFNKKLKETKLENKYPLIQEGDKIKFVYLLEPNTVGENCIAFSTELPKELNLHRYVDYNTMFTKSFLDPIDGILKCVGWNHKPVATLEDLFS